jgi:murein DD-endopeptidase MepM/ murein hydrolase activator NlpD/sugar lactone lactonase YvrE
MRHSPRVAWLGLSLPALVLVLAREASPQTYTASTYAGSGGATFGGDGGPATSAGIRSPSGVALDTSGNLYIVDWFDRRVRRVDAVSGIITTVAGNGGFGFAGDGGLATEAPLYNPHGVAVDRSGNIFIADSMNHRVRRVDAATGIITTVAGNGEVFGSTGDGGPATQARLAYPTGVAVDAAGNLYIADGTLSLGDNVGERIRRVSATTQEISTVAGNGDAGYSGDGGPAINASLNGPRQVAVDSAGNLFIADRDNRRVRRVDAATGVITSIFSAPSSLPLDAVGLDRFDNVYFAIDNQIRRLDPSSGTETAVFGTGGLGGFGGDGGPALEAKLSSPQAVVVDSADRVYVADQGNHRVRWGIPTLSAACDTAGLRFTGASGSYGTLPYHASLSFGGALTIEGWLFLDAYASWAPLVTKGVTTGEYSLRQDSGGHLQFYANDGTSHTRISCNSLTVLPLSRWTHVAATFDGVTISLYLNGGLDQTCTTADVLYSNTEGLVIGADLPEIAEYLRGAVDEIRVWNTVRTVAELQAGMNNQLSAAEPGLVALLHLNEGSGATFVDGVRGGAGSLTGTYEWLTSGLPLLGSGDGRVSGLCLAWPVSPDDRARLHNDYGQYDYVREDKYHVGLDIASTTSQRTLAAASGVVVKIQGNHTGCAYPTPGACEDHGYGNTVVIRHDSAQGHVYTQYSHLDSIEGSLVSRCGPLDDDKAFRRTCTTPVPVVMGQGIGVPGASAYGQGAFPDMGVHLHFELKTFSTLGTTGDDAGEFGYTGVHPADLGFFDPVMNLHSTSAASAPITITANANLRVGPGGAENGSIYRVTAPLLVGERYDALASAPATTSPSCSTGWLQIAEQDRSPIPDNLGGSQEEGWVCADLTDYRSILSVELAASPAGGLAPVDDVDLTATVGGAATGTINYTFYCDRTDSGTNVTPGWAAKFDAVTENPKTAADVCTYPAAGSYTAKVIIERGAGAAEDRTRIDVMESPCTDFSIEPTAANPGSAAGSQTVTLSGSPAGCTGGNWSASGNGSWITVSVPSGSGPGSVTVSWPQNTGPARSGSATIAGDVFTVNQQGVDGGLDFFTVRPCRVFDTRESSGPTGGAPLTCGAEQSFAVAGRCEVPANAKAVSLNLTGTGSTAHGNVRLFASGTTAPLASSLNYAAGQTRANNAVAPLGDGGRISVLCSPSGTTHVVLDVNGYFQ